LFVIFKELQPVRLHPGLWGLLINVATIIVVTMLSPRDDSERAREFLQVASTPE